MDSTKFDESALRQVPVADVRRDLINAPTTAERIERLRPEVIFVSGAPLLHRNIYSLASEAAVNLHHGITPQYRGQNTLFWALYNEDPDGIGITFHHLDSGFDSGAVIEQCWPALGGGESEREILVACTQLAVKRAPVVVSKLKPARPLTEKGTFYPTVQRTPLTDFKVAWRKPRLPGREERWF